MLHCKSCKVTVVIVVFVELRCNEDADTLRIRFCLYFAPRSRFAL